MHSYSKLFPVILAGALTACGGNTDVEESLYAGTYQTAVQLTATTCTGITVQNQPTTVQHQAGSSSITLRHASQDYTGTVDAAGAFTTVPKAISAGNATHTLTIGGRFAGGGFTADVQAQVTSTGAPACTYTVHWIGTR